MSVVGKVANSIQSLGFTTCILQNQSCKISDFLHQANLSNQIFTPGKVSKMQQVHHLNCIKLKRTASFGGEILKVLSYNAVFFSFILVSQTFDPNLLKILHRYISRIRDILQLWCGLELFVEEDNYGLDLFNKNSINIIYDMSNICITDILTKKFKFTFFLL